MARLLKGVFCGIVTLLTVIVLFCLNTKRKQDLNSGVQYAQTTFVSTQSSLSYESTIDVPDLMATVKKFVFFVGYARSGHSIIGALMDAHPHIVIAHEFNLFSMFHELNKVPDDRWKSNLFEMLKDKSMSHDPELRAKSKKGYTLEVKGLWQGRFDKYIEVIGDKSGGRTTLKYLEDKSKLVKNYRKLEQMLSIPIRIIHAVRNPFDIISTKLNFKLTNASAYRNLKLSFQSTSSLSSSTSKIKVSDKNMKKVIKWMFDLVSAVAEMIEKVFGRENVLEVHNCDLVRNPREILSRIFQFMEVDTTEQFLDACAAKVFKSVSKSRDTIEWRPEFKKMVEENMKKYEMFNRYSFTSDC